MNRLIIGLAACGLLVTGCDGGPSSQPPAEISQACISTNFGHDVLYAPEWIKPLTSATSMVTWEREGGDMIIFRSLTPNPLNGETKTVSILFAPAIQPIKTASFCQGYFEPVLADINGIEQPVSALRQELAYLHMMGLQHYGGSPPPEGPYILEYGQ